MGNPNEARRPRRWRTLALTAAATMAVCGSSTARAAVLVGSPTLAAHADSNLAGVAEAFSFVASSSGSVGRLNVYVAGTPTASSAIIGLYADSAGRPGTLLTRGTMSPLLADAWNGATVSAATVTAGSTYWIAVLAPSGGGTFSFLDGAVPPPSGPAEVSSATALGALPATWASGATFADSPISATAESVTTPSVGVAPTSISFAAAAGSSPTAQTLRLTNLGGGILDWSAISDAPWLSTIPANGVGPADITVAPTTASLAPGSYTAHVTISAPGADTPTTVIPVTLTVNSPSGSDTVAPTVALTEDALA